MATSAFGRILLITGNAEFLAARTRARALEQIRAEQPGCEVTEASAGGLAPGELTAMTGASLFSDATAIILTEIQDLSAEAGDELLELASSRSPDLVVVCVHSGGQKGKGLLDKLRACDSVTEVKVAAPKYERDYVSWVRTEARDLGRSTDEQAASVLVQAIGQDLRSLAGAVDQLATTTPEGESISVEEVRRYFGGRAEVRGYEIADAALEGRIALALEKLRWAQTARVAPVLITAACASALRALAQVAAAAPGLSDGDVAKLAGVPPFKVRTIRQQLRSWDPEGLKRAIAAVARADLDVKGGTSDPGYATERMVISVAASRRR